jgi:glycosyltransferase involved in cell wall biosynthesis
MHRICSSLAENGYQVTLLGWKLTGSLPLTHKKFNQKRITCFFKPGKFRYAEYNIRLFFYLLFQKTDAICAIDLDTILPCYYISRLKKVRKIYDAHELFTELKEVMSRPAVYKKWLSIEKRIIPRFKSGYTVSESIADYFRDKYKVNYQTIRNVPVLKNFSGDKSSAEKFILYQGAVNEARAFEWLIPAMKEVKTRLVICGDGNFMPQLKQLISENNVADKIEIKGMLHPDALFEISQQAYCGISLAENTGLNQYFALPNKFFDYIHAGLPQLTMNYPEYQKLNAQYEVAVLTDDLSPAGIAAAINNLLGDDVLHKRLKENCIKAREELCWQKEENKLLSFYHSVFNQ